MHIGWKYIGLVVSCVFKGGPECGTMIGPMDIETEQREPVNRLVEIQEKG